MKTAPVIPVDEFLSHTVRQEETDCFQVAERLHPDFGFWRERSIDLGHIRVFEHKADFNRKVNVHFTDHSLRDNVHHCMSVDGEMGAHFQHLKLSAHLNPKTFHQVYLPGQEYHLSMQRTFVNVHVEVKRDYYTSLLCDSERWSAEMKQKLLDSQVFYTGEFQLSLPMMRVIHSIFDSPISGSLKKLLIEAKVHELIALQLNSTVNVLQGKANPITTELFQSIRQYLDQTFLQDHSLKNIARHFAINEFSLKKGFKENFNTTVFEYLLNKRLEHGLELLQTGQYCVEEVGSTVGYKYPNHFSTAFKKRFGISPVQVRN
jgi:AraC-like DNA-binding protein